MLTNIRVFESPPKQGCNFNQNQHSSSARDKEEEKDDTHYNIYKNSESQVCMSLPQ